MIHSSGQPELFYDRRGGDALVEALMPGGFAHSLVTFATKGQMALDLRTRGYPGVGMKRATLYMGMETVIDLRIKGGRFHLKPHSRLGTREFGWDHDWEQEHTAEDLADKWGSIDLYLERVIPRVPMGALVEGLVQAAVCRRNHADMIVIDREVKPKYTNRETLRSVNDRLQRPLLEAVEVRGAERWWDSRPRALGDRCDALAIDRQGTLLTIEVKPWNATKGIQWAPLQARHYANLFAEWARQVGHSAARDVLIGMIDERQRMGLLAEAWDVALPIRVQPVVVIGTGSHHAAKERMCQVQRRLADSHQDDPPLLIKSARMWGDLEDLAC